ncbi:Uncharacterized membrane protein [Alkalithermobacter thermoalcaliphilus JW-YL-7 = DSM 7308]|uniref:Uncharacterized membrane protein n=1 Tax=Alkalithermobacter thermoalcaliphilus JW-YL-7 = DSM 7308 TaxID=1121328 RepID=A0A150FN17_CLOPD|nr:Protein of unknown function DUF2157, membrane [[Clostridium] paradoxum JW-YL-7 = DSM 7308]SHL27071.1 Uncharacterized membrane protein [[Clostridium] paradoxum JW-YL-7 = DSM 7308]
MKKRLVSKSQLNFLEEELDYCKNKNIITVEQKNAILEEYTLQKINFVKIVLVIGAVLIGLGVLSFIASNWDKISKMSKFLVILILYVAVNTSSFGLSIKYPKTSKSLLYLGVIIYGAGIFLIGQIFNYGGDFTNAFLLWGIGILPCSVIFREEIIFIFSHVLLLVYLNGHFNFYDMPYFIIGIVPLMYYLNRYFDNFKIGTFFNNLILLNSILYFLVKNNVKDLYVAWIFFLIGLIMYYTPLKLNRFIFKLQGMIVIGISGLALTNPYIWSKFNIFSNGELVSIVFSILFVAFMLILAKSGSLLSVVFICATILRYYFDTLYDFLPKSVFFIIGGVILLAFGIYFEKQIKKGGDLVE